MRLIRRFLQWILGLDDVIARLERIEKELRLNSEVSTAVRDRVVTPIQHIGLP